MLAQKINLKCKITHAKVSLKSSRLNDDKTVSLYNIYLLFLEFVALHFKTKASFTKED